MDSEKVISEFEDFVKSFSKRDYTYYKGLFVSVLALLKEQEAKQGKWERHYSRPRVYADLFWWCSCCGEPTSYCDAGLFYRYCPKCGAKLEPCRDD